MPRSHVCRTWGHEPRRCKSRKEAEDAKRYNKDCAHCGEDFTVSTGPRLWCEENGYALPKRCAACRELFRHKPFQTVEKTHADGRTIYRTYNSQGQVLI